MGLSRTWSILLQLRRGRWGDQRCDITLDGLISAISFGRRGNYGIVLETNRMKRPPKRDWRDWFIMATVMGGVGYGMEDSHILEAAVVAGKELAVKSS
jgi:hypothetical protein